MEFMNENNNKEMNIDEDIKNNYDESSDFKRENQDKNTNFKEYNKNEEDEYIDKKISRRTIICTVIGLMTVFLFILNLINIIVAFIVGLLSLIEILKKNNNNKRNRTVALIGFIFALTGIILSVTFLHSISNGVRKSGLDKMLIKEQIENIKK